MGNVMTPQEVCLAAKAKGYTIVARGVGSETFFLKEHIYLWKGAKRI